PGCPTLDDAVRLAAGGDHVCATRTGGGIACWGSSTYGQLGTGTYSRHDRAVPVCEAGVFDGSSCNDLGTPTALGGAVDVVAGERFTCALMADTSVRCWGDNGDGQLGRGSSGGDAPLPSPVCASGQAG